MKKGFTLIELLVTIVGILASIVLTTLSNAFGHSQVHVNDGRY